MNSISSEGTDGSETVNYDSDPLLEVAIDETDYRIDPGKQGTALSISTRRSGSWAWAFCAEARWDGSSLRTKQLERPLREALGARLKQALAELES